MQQILVAVFAALLATATANNPCVRDNTGLGRCFWRQADCLAAGYSPCTSLGDYHNKGPGPKGDCDSLNHCFSTTPVGSADDPFVEGWHGQHFYFEGRDGWYAALSDSHVQVNLKLTNLGHDNKVSYWTGATVQYFNDDGSVAQTLTLEVRDHKATEVSCADIGASGTCIGNGGIDVTLNGVRVVQPAEFSTGPGYSFAAANLIDWCKQKSQTYKLLHSAESGRKLAQQPFEEFVIQRELMDSNKCAEWMHDANENNGGIFNMAGEHSTFRFQGPTLSGSFEYYKYQFEGKQYYRLDFFAGDYDVKDVTEPEGFLGETLRARTTENGEMVAPHEVLKGEPADYMVAGPLADDFFAKHMAEFHE